MSISWQELDARVEAFVERRAGTLARDRSFADALRTIAASVRAGSTLPQALARVGDGRRNDHVARACQRAAACIALGRPIEQEVDQLAVTIDTQSARLFARIVRVQHRRGGDLGSPCHRLALLAHDRLRLDAEARSATAQARFSARAVLAIPLLLAVAAAWRAPDAARELVQPTMLLVATPGIALIVAGAWTANRIARSATQAGVGLASPRTRQSPVRRGFARFAGDGPLARRSARLGAGALSICVPLLVMTGAAAGTVGSALVLVGVACMWPWTDRARERRHRAEVARSGIETLLEVSIALFAAGATAHEVAVQAPAAVPEPLRSVLAPAVHRVGLGRSISAAFGSLEEVAASPQLDGWLHAVCSSAELGATSVDVLEQLLRDARSARREQLRAIAQTAAPRMQLALVLLVVPGVMWIMLLATTSGLLRQLQAAGVM